MICAYCDAAGVDWTDALEAQLTGKRLMARFAYWAKHPPQSVMIRALAAWAGVYKPRGAFKASSAAEMKAFARRFGSKG